MSNNENQAKIWIDQMYRAFGTQTAIFSLQRDFNKKDNFFTNLLYVLLVAGGNFRYWFFKVILIGPWSSFELHSRQGNSLSKLSSILQPRGTVVTQHSALNSYNTHYTPVYEKCRYSILAILYTQYIKLIPKKKF